MMYGSQADHNRITGEYYRDSEEKSNEAGNSPLLFQRENNSSEAMDSSKFKPASPDDF